MRKIRHTRAEVLRRVEAEYAALDALVRRLGPRGLTRVVPGFGARARIARERWRGRDALAHIVEWKRQALRGIRREAADPELRGLPIEEKNRLLYERWRGRPLRALLAYHREVHRDTVIALRARPASYFRDPPRSPSWPNDLIGHASGHRTRHLERLLDRERRARPTRPGSPAGA